jgi:hypothetical protein
MSLETAAGHVLTVIVLIGFAAAFLVIGRFIKKKIAPIKRALLALIGSIRSWPPRF